jgi:hypothetical protein
MFMTTTFVVPESENPLIRHVGIFDPVTVMSANPLGALMFVTPLPAPWIVMFLSVIPFNRLMLQEPLPMLTMSPSTEEEIAPLSAEVMSPLQVIVRVVALESEGESQTAAISVASVNDR